MALNLFIKAGRENSDGLIWQECVCKHDWWGWRKQKNDDFDFGMEEVSKQNEC